MNVQSITDFYKGKRIFLTGHTGFKGCWLAWWLKELGADVTGYALPPEKDHNNLFELTGLKDAVVSIEGDICDEKHLQKCLKKSEPDLVFHLAAQSLLGPSYKIPVQTYTINVIGTINVLEAIRSIDAIKSTVIVTSDKCYANYDHKDLKKHDVCSREYREDDPLGGCDPYSSSKAMAEIATAAYRRSFFNTSNKGVASARAGNVIGGGDFAAYRIVPDIFDAISKHDAVLLRHPDAVRPWQYVLDALFGYLVLAKKVYEDPKTFSTSFNFSVQDNECTYSVKEITEKFIRAFGKGHYKIDPSAIAFDEVECLHLNSSKAKEMLDWQGVFSIDETIDETVRWYKAFLNKTDDLQDLTIRQIHAFSKQCE